MSLFLQTSIISLLMISLCCLPLLFKAMRKMSHLFFLVGTGALIGICFLDLIPDVVELGGSSSLFMVLAVWLAFSVIHFFHYRHHVHSEGELHHHHEEGKGIGVFLSSMVIHCISSGVLLAIATRFNAHFSRAVFMALIAHKCYESLIVSSIILERVKSIKKVMAAMVGYALALPFGVIVASVLNEQIGLKLAMFATCFALGSLLGCMVFDFLLPSLKHIKQRRMEAAWIVVGLLLTEVMMRFHSGG